MVVPIEIIDGLESILDIFLSDIRHRERAAFILCDNLVETSCKTKAVEHNHLFVTKCGFHAAWNAPGVDLPSPGLGDRVHSRRATRNLMQHSSAAATVDNRACADAICDVMEVINHCWQNSSIVSLTHWQKIALRIVILYSRNGQREKHQEFEDAMRGENWRNDSEKRRPKVNEHIIEVGLRRHWLLIIKGTPSTVESILNACNIR